MSAGLLLVLFFPFFFVNLPLYGVFVYVAAVVIALCIAYVITLVFACYLLLAQFLLLSSIVFPASSRPGSGKSDEDSERTAVRHLKGGMLEDQTQNALI